MHAKSEVDGIAAYVALLDAHEVCSALAAARSPAVRPELVEPPVAGPEGLDGAPPPPLHATSALQRFVYALASSAHVLAPMKLDQEMEQEEGTPAIDR